MNNIDDSGASFCVTPPRDRRNQRRVVLWSTAWALAFISLTVAVRIGWLTGGAAIAAVIGSAGFGIATLMAYYRFLRETDELRRKIEVEALALAFGIGVVGGLTYWLLFVNGLVPGRGFAFVFVAMILAHALGVTAGRRRYS